MAKSTREDGVSGVVWGFMRVFFNWVYLSIWMNGIVGEFDVSGMAGKVHNSRVACEFDLNVFEWEFELSGSR